MSKSTLTTELVRRVLSYDPETGIFRWKQPISRRVMPGQEAGALSSNGRLYIGVMGEKVAAHRLAWFYIHGEWPLGNVAPVNGNHADVRLANLKQETVADTARKGGKRSTNTSGLPGVSWSTSKSKWVATITRGYKRVHLGYFNEAAGASAAYQAALAEFPKDKGAQTRGAGEIAMRRRQWALWRGLIRSGVQTGWPSFELFVTDVLVPQKSMAIAALDETKLIGPGNFRLVEPPVSSASMRAKVHRAANPGQYREIHLIKTFGIDNDEFKRMFAAQGGVCKICAHEETSKRGGKTKWLAVDHDHVTEEVRGLLCHRHNQGMGFFDDNPLWLRAAADYLEAYFDKQAAEIAAANVAPSTNVVALVKKDSA